MPGFTDNSAGVLCNFRISPLFWSNCWCAFLQLLFLCNSYQFMCSCVASPQRVVASGLLSWKLGYHILFGWSQCTKPSHCGPQLHGLMRSEVVPKSFAMLLKKCGMPRGPSASSRDQHDPRALGTGRGWFLYPWRPWGLAAGKQRDRVGEVGGSCSYMLNLWSCCWCWCRCCAFASYTFCCLNLRPLQD